MKRILLIGGGILAVLIIALFTIPFLIPKEVYKTQIETAATNALQRDVTLTGDVSLSVFPRIAAGVEGVTIANPDGFPEPNMLTAGELRGSVKWMPLLSGKVDIEELAFVDATVKLHKLANGRTNWAFAASTEPSESGDGSTGGGVDAGIESARLENAALTYQDDTSGTVYTLSELDLSASMQAMDQPLTVSAGGVFQDAPFDLSLKLDSLEAISKDQTATAIFKLTTAFAALSYDGDVQLAGDGRILGELNASSSDLRKLLDVADVEIAPGETLQSFFAQGRVSGSFSSFSVADLSLALDDISGSGEAGLDLTGARPKVTGDLAMGALDLTPFLGETDSDDGPASAASGWSTEPLDLSSLKAVDADIALSTPALTLGDIAITDAAVKAVLSNGRLSMDLQRFTSFGGNWSGQMVVNARGTTPSYSFDMASSNIAIVEMLTTFTGFESLTGVGNFDISASSTGASLDGIVNALNGRVTSNLADGALQGINIAELVRSAGSLQSAFTSGDWSSLNLGAVMSPTAQTDFTSFDTVLTINNGVANVDLMKLVNPILNMDGSGQINFGGQSLDLRLATGIDQTAQGQESTIQVNGIPVPVRVSGPWANPSISPDISGIQSALQAELGNQIQNEISNRIGGDAGDILGTVLGSGSGDAEDENDAVLDALGGLFGRDDDE